MIQIAIVEDNESERIRLKECLAFVEASEQTPFHIFEFSNGLEFLNADSSVFDIVFMDIEMPGMDGMEAARALRQTNSSVILIFVTNMAQYAISGYEVDALDFILKPINKYSFAIKLKRAISRISQKAEDYISVKTDGEIRSVRVSSIRWLDVNGHYVVYHTMTGDLSEYVTLKEASEKMNSSFFVSPNRSCYVNMHFVKAVSRENVTLDNGVKIDISRPQRKAFFETMSDYMGGR